MQEGLLVFDVEVVNASNHELLVAPEAFHYYPLSTPQDSIRKKGTLLRFAARDPEREILEADKALARAHAKYANQSIALLFLATANVAANLATADKVKTEQQREERHLNNQGFWAGFAQLSYMNEAQHANQVTFLNNAKINWAGDPLRKTTLLPNESVRGRVFVESYPAARYVRLVMPFEQTQVNLLFRQEAHDSRANAAPMPIHH
jgi:hypothetical protein